MKKRVAYRGVAWVCVLVGAAAVAGSGCSDLKNYVDTNEAGVKDGGKGGASGSSSRSSSKGGSGGSAGRSSGGAMGGSSQMGGQNGSASSLDAGVDAPANTGGSAGETSSGVAGSGGSNGQGGSSGGVNASSGGSTVPLSSGGSGGSNSRDAGYDLGVDHPVNPTTCTSAATCPAPSGGNGIAVCQNGVCGITCNLGHHRCNNSCLADISVDSCGSQCGPCAKPASNGMATCGGIPLACGINCDLGYHACGSSCVVNGSTSTNSCGNNCTQCTAPANGSVSCNGRTCVQTCNSGYHLCNGTCLPNNSVDGCGTASCSPCRVPGNGSPTCNGTSCGFECNSNYHKCGNNCASNTDPNNCGSSCKACPGDLNGTPACSAGDCAVNCKNGFHWCANVSRCVANGSTWPGSCGNNCTVCPTATGAVATCDGSKCGLEYSSCPEGLALCGTDCVEQDTRHCGPTSCRDCSTLTTPTDTHMVCEANACTAKCDDPLINCAGEGATPVCVSPTSTSLDHCGGSCTACPDPGPLGTVACTGSPLECAITCGDTAHKCGTTCKLKTDATACGATCKTCSTTVAHALPACLNENCDFECEPTFHRCADGSCQSDTDPGACGDTCEVCPSDQICEGGHCVLSSPPDAG